MTTVCPQIELAEPCKKTLDDGDSFTSDGFDKLSLSAGSDIGDMTRKRLRRCAFVHAAVHGDVRMNR